MPGGCRNGEQRAKQRAGEHSAMSDSKSDRDIRSRRSRLSSVNFGPAGERRPDPEQAVWGDVRSTAQSHAVRRLGLFLLLLSAACNLALAGPKMSHDLQAMKSNGDIEVIVQF